jgi:hypothetical protein
MADTCGNPMIAYVAEFQNRKNLTELGYRFDPDKLSAKKAAIFMTIASEYQDLCERKNGDRSD